VSHVALIKKCFENVFLVYFHGHLKQTSYMYIIKRYKICAMSKGRATFTLMHTAADHIIYI